MELRQVLTWDELLVAFDWGGGLAHVLGGWQRHTHLLHAQGCSSMARQAQLVCDFICSGNGRQLGLPMEPTASKHR